MRESDGRVASQSLLLPITALLSPEEQSAASEFSAEIESLGFKFEIGDGYANISAIPDSISAMEAEALFIKMADDIVSGRGNPEVTEKIRREQMLYQIACKAAIKGGRIYDKSVSEWIVSKVIELSDVIVCPHGRPIAYKLTKNELDRQFERIK
jgi:DNA mismatch repair protein MutL